MKHSWFKAFTEHNWRTFALLNRAVKHCSVSWMRRVDSSGSVSPRGHEEVNWEKCVTFRHLRFTPPKPITLSNKYRRLLNLTKKSWTQTWLTVQESRQVSEAKIKRREIEPERMSDRVRLELLVRFNLNASPEGWDLIHIGKIQVLSASWLLFNPVALNKSKDVHIQVKYSLPAAVRYEANQGRS